MTPSNISDSVTVKAASVEAIPLRPSPVLTTAAGSAILGSGTPTASIIPFPGRPKPVHAAPVSVAPEVRLARALKSLSVALTEQRAVLAAWRDALGELKTTTTGLTDSLNRYRSDLGTLGESVSSLNEKAQALQNFANGGAAHDA